MLNATEMDFMVVSFYVLFLKQIDRSQTVRAHSSHSHGRIFTSPV